MQRNEKLLDLICPSRCGTSAVNSFNFWHEQSSAAGRAIYIVNHVQIALGDEPKNVPNPWVQFRIDDVYVPEPAQILMELHGKDVLLGKVIDISDSETHGEPFAVVEVDGLARPVVVPLKHLKEVQPE